MSRQHSTDAMRLSDSKVQSRRLAPPAKRAAAFEASGPTDGAVGTIATAPERPRTGVSIACNRCRLRKRRCNGAKPACVSCTTANQVCAYKAPIVSKTKSGDLLVEAIGLLNTLAPSQATAAISSLRGKEDPAAIINSLRHTAEVANQACPRLGPSSGKHSSCTSDLEVEQSSCTPNSEDAHFTDESNISQRIQGSLSADSTGRIPQQLSNESLAAAGELCAGYTASLHGMQEKVRKLIQPMSSWTAIAFMLTDITFEVSGQSSCTCCRILKDDELRNFDSRQAEESRLRSGLPPGTGPSSASLDRQSRQVGQDKSEAMLPDPTQPPPLSRRRTSDNTASFRNGVLEVNPVQKGIASHLGYDQVPAPLGTSKVQTGSNIWTTVTRDIYLIQHLLDLYFCWEYPVTPTLSKEHFLNDFSEGRPRYCSSILVNALLALGCQFSSKLGTRTVSSIMHTSGNHFFDECQRLLSLEEDHRALTTIQALGIMSIRETRCGRDLTSLYYGDQSIRLAMGMDYSEEVGGDPDQLAVRRATFWGAFALDNARSLVKSMLPQSSRYPFLPPKFPADIHVEAALWIPYSDDDVSDPRSVQQASNIRSVFDSFCELSKVVHQSLYDLYSPTVATTGQDLCNIHKKYLNWYAHIPEALRLDLHSTPAVLFTHMYYHYAILLLFRPCMKFRIIGSSILPRDVCSQAADAIQDLLRSYSAMYTLRCTPALLPQFALAAAIMRLAITAQYNTRSMEHERTLEPSKQLEESASVACAVRQGLNDLRDMSLHHQFAGQALESLHRLARTWGIGLSASDDVPFPSHTPGTGTYTLSLDFDGPKLREEDFVRANLRAVASEEPSALADLIPKIPAAPAPLISAAQKTARDMIESLGVAKPVIQIQAPRQTMPDCPIRFSPAQYDYDEISTQSRVRTSVFRNSVWNTAHYSNLQFSPEEWRPENEITPRHHRGAKEVQGAV